jgi:hypothetical protein
VIDLESTYRRLATTLGPRELETRYRDAERRADQPHEQAAGALPLVASAIPLTATTSVAIHVLHALPPNAPGELTQQLLATAGRNAASALQRCDGSLQGDGVAHGYRTEEWLPIIIDIAGGVLRSASLNEDPPTVVAQAQQAIEWLSRAVVQLHEDSSEAASTLCEVLACLLVICVFADAARTPADLP